VYMWSDFSFSVACQFDHGNYPHDVQRCCAQMDDQRTFALRIKVSDTARNSLTESLMKTHLTLWEVTSAEINENPLAVQLLTDWKKDPYQITTSNCELCVNLRRKATYYSSELVGPAIATAIITLVSFAAKSTSHQMYILLASIGLQIVSYFVAAIKLPNPTHGTPAILMFYSVNMAMTIIALVAAILLVRLSTHKTNVPPPHFIDMIVALVSRLLCVRDNSDEQQIQDDVSLEKSSLTSNGKYYWSPLAQCLRNFIFVLLFVIYFISVAACFVF